MEPIRLNVKRIYDFPGPNDGKRVLVDRLWPRGMSKQQAQLDEWMREVAPSAELRKWFGHKPERFTEFRKQYEEELALDALHRKLTGQLCDWAAVSPVSLLYAAKDPVCNHAVILQQWVINMSKERKDR